MHNDTALMSLQGRRVLVTGAAGFIGSHLVHALLRAGVGQLVAVDNVRHGCWTNLGRASDDPRLEIVEADLSEQTSAALAAMLRNVDYVFHLAAEKHSQSVDNPERVLQVNVTATFRLFEQGARMGGAKIIFASSLYAYGRTTPPPMQEDEPSHPWTVYGISKLTGEHLLTHLQRRHGTAHAILRLFFVYGPRQFAGTGYKSVVVANFERILAGRAPLVCGDGEQRLDYVFVDDAVHALLLAAISDTSTGPINIASGHGVSVLDLTAHMLRAAGSSLRPVFREADWTAGTTRVGDASKALRCLGWKARTPLDVGLQRTFDWVKQHTHAVQ